MTDHLQDIKKSFSDLGIELKMGIEESNIGACTGEWIVADDMHELVSHNPTDGQPIASIIQADEAAYETVVATAAEAFKTWRMMPAPARGEIVRISATSCEFSRIRWAGWCPSKWARSSQRVWAKSRR